MKNLSVTLLTLVCFVSGAEATWMPASSDSVYRLAVFPLAVKGFSKEESSAVRVALITHIQKAKPYRIMSDAAMQAVLTDIGFSQIEECTTVACAAYFGGMLSVEGVVQGRLERDEQQIRLLVRIVNVEKSSIVYERTLIAPPRLEDLISHGMTPLQQDLPRIQLVTQTNVRWYTVAAVVVGSSLVVYFVAKALGFDVFGGTEKEREKEGGSDDE